MFDLVVFGPAPVGCRPVVDRLEFWWCGVMPVLIEEVSKTQGYNMLVSFDVVTYAET